MSTFCDQFQRCMRHPHQRIVGICSSCLQERLESLIRPLSPPQLARAGSSLHAHAITTTAHTLLAPEIKEPSIHSHANLPTNIVAKPTPGKNADTCRQGKVTFTQTGSPLTMFQHSHEEMRNLRTQALRQSRHSSDFVNAASSPDQNNCIRTHAKAASIPAYSSPLNKENRASEIRQHRQVDVPVSSKVDALGNKKLAPLFSASKSKNSSRLTSVQVDERKLSQCGALKGPQHASTSVSRAAESTVDKYRHTHVSDLEAIAEIHKGDTTGKMQDQVSREPGLSTSWFSNLFHRKRGPRCRSNLSNSSGSSITNTDAITSNGTAFNELSRHSPKNSVADAARLSCDGARPSFKQLLKKFEARSKQQRTDFSPSQFVNYTMKEYDGNGQLAPYLQKSKSVASARSSISVEMPKDFMQSSFSPSIHQRQSNVMVGLESDAYFDDRNLRRSRSWGRTWNRALSPLWGSRSHRHKGVHDSPSSRHQNSHLCAGSGTPSQIDSKVVSTSASSLHLSPLRRSHLAPADARIHLAH